MRNIIYILFVCILCMSCYHDEYLGLDYQSSNDKENINSKHVYIYDSLVINYTTCQITGIIDNVYVNRKCNIYDGYIDIGTTNVFNVKSCFVDIFIYVGNEIIKLKENKIIYEK